MVHNVRMFHYLWGASMHQILFAGLACTCAGALCALVGDLRRQVSLGLVGFLALNLLIWARLVAQIVSMQELDLVAAQFLVSQGLATGSYLGMVYFLDRAPQPAGEAAVTGRD